MSGAVSLPSRRWLVLLLGVSALVLAAGCLSLVGPADDDPTTDDTDSIATGEETDSAGTDAGAEAESDVRSERAATEGDEATDPGETVDALVLGNDETGTDDEAGSETGEPAQASLQDAHAEAIEESETITTTVRANLETGLGDVSLDSTTRIDLASNQARQRTLTEGSTAGGLLTTTFADVESYATPEATYERTESDYSDGTEYSHTPIENGTDAWDEESLTEYLQTDLVDNADDNVIWTRDGTETFDGTETVRYVADGEDHFDGFQENATSAIDERAEDESADEEATGFSLDEDDSVTITSMHATLLVSTDGVARYLSFEVEGTVDDDPVTLTIELSITDIDDTTVTAPDWLEEAETAST